MTKMSEDLATNLDRDLRAAASPEERAVLLYDIVRAFHGHLKPYPDGLNGDIGLNERMGVGAVADAARTHLDLTAPGRLDIE